MDKVYIERPTICDVLREKIRKFKKEHPRFSSSQIARKWDLSSSTINRIENRDIKSVSIDIAVKVLRGCGNKEDIADFIRTYFPDVHEGLYEYFVEQSTREDRDDLEKYFTDESTYKMMLMATTKAGLSENYVLQEYGRHGHQIFMKLASKGIFKNVDGRFYACEKDIYLKLAPTLKINQYISKEVSEECLTLGAPKCSSIELNYESVNYEKVKDELKSLTVDYTNEVKKILKNKNNVGNDFVLVSSLLTKLN